MVVKRMISRRQRTRRRTIDGGAAGGAGVRL